MRLAVPAFDLFGHWAVQQELWKLAVSGTYERLVRLANQTQEDPAQLRKKTGPGRAHYSLTSFTSGKDSCLPE